MSVSSLPLNQKSENDLLKFTSAFHDVKRTITAEKTKIDKLIKQGARSRKVKMAIQKFQEYEAILNESPATRRNLLKPVSSTAVSNAEKIATEINSIDQQAMTDALNYIDSCITAANDPLENIEILMFLVWNVRGYQKTLRTVLLFWKNPMRMKHLTKD